nr:nucleic acid-binding, OB-fold protein [Tanacetum cinerariifolium]
SATSATHEYLNPNIPETYHIKQQCLQVPDTVPVLKIDNQRYEDPEIEKNRNHGQANSLTSDCNELLVELIDKDPYHLPYTLTELEDTTHIFQLHFDSESTKRKRDCVLDRVFKHQPLPLPALSVESVTLSSTSHGQPEQMPKPKPASPALSTSAINEPPPTQEIIAAQKEDKAANLKPKYDDVTSSMKMEQRTQMKVNSSKKC